MRSAPSATRDLAFGTVLLAAAYTVVLLVLAAIDAPNRFTDMIKIFLVVIRLLRAAARSCCS